MTDPLHTPPEVIIAKCRVALEAAKAEIFWSEAAWESFDDTYAERKIKAALEMIERNGYGD